MESPIIILQGITPDQLKDMLRDLLREEGVLKPKEPRFVSLAEACRQLDITFRPLKERMEREGIVEMSDQWIEVFRKKYPKRKRIY